MFKKKLIDSPPWQSVNRFRAQVCLSSVPNGFYVMATDAFPSGVGYLRSAIWPHSGNVAVNYAPQFRPVFAYDAIQ